MAGRTQLAAELMLRLYKGETVAGFGGTWITLFTTNPPVDTNALHSGTVAEWGPARVQIFGNSGLGSPYWSEPDFAPSDPNFKSQITNVGSVQWNSITLTSSPNTVTGFGIYQTQTGVADLLAWGTLDSIAVADGQDFVLGSGVVKIEAD